MNALPEVLEQVSSTTCGTNNMASATTSLMPVHDTTAPETTSTIFAILPLPIVLHRDHPTCSSISLHRWQNDLFFSHPSSTFPVHRSISWWKHALPGFKGTDKLCLDRSFLNAASSLSFDRCAARKSTIPGATNSGIDRGIVECYALRALVKQSEKYLRIQDVDNHGNCNERKNRRTNQPRWQKRRRRTCSSCGDYWWLLFLMLVCLMETIKGLDKVPDCQYISDGSQSEVANDRNCGIRQLVDQWVGVGGNAATVTATYGSIENWDTSLVTDMSNLFSGYHCGTRFYSFNEDLATWDTSKVTTMQNSTVIFFATIPLSK